MYILSWYSSYFEVACRAEEDVGVPRAFAYRLFEERTSIPLFMDWIKEVKVT